MKMMRIAVFALLLSLVCTFSYADGGEVSSWQKINQISLGWGLKRVNINANNIPNPHECDTTGVTAQADETLDNIDYIMSMSLAAFMADKEVQLVISTDSCSAAGRPRLISINVR